MINNEIDCNKKKWFYPTLWSQHLRPIELNNAMIFKITDRPEICFWYVFKRKPYFLKKRSALTFGSLPESVLCFHLIFSPHLN